MKRKLIVVCGWLLILALFTGGCSPKELFRAWGDKSKALKYGYEDLMRINVIEKDADQVGEGRFLCAEEDGFVQEMYEYYYSKLNTEEQKLYNEIKNIFGRMGSDVPLLNVNLESRTLDETLTKVFQCVLNDHPELFYVKGYSVTKYNRGKKLTAVEFSGDYEGTAEFNLRRAEQMEAAASKVLGFVGENADAYERVKRVYEWVICTTDYVSDAPDNQNIYSVLVNHESVCQGYAKTVQYLLNRLQVPCSLVLGTARSSSQAPPSSHSWNLVSIDDQFYYLDATWGDAAYSGGAGKETPAIRYEFLNMTTQELLLNHTPDEIVPLPVCSARKANYYYREGAYFFSCDEEQAAALAKRCFVEEKEPLYLKCDDPEVMEELKKKLVDDKLLLSTLGPGRHSMSYLEDPDYLTMTFWVTSK